MTTTTAGAGCGKCSGSEDVNRLPDLLERILSVIELVLHTEIQYRTIFGRNKGEADHASRTAVRIDRQGWIRDRTTEGHHLRAGRAVST